jgi:hypothetical protein
MLIQRGRPGWGRDPGIEELIAHLDQKEAKWLAAGKKYDLWASLNRSELDVIIRETEKCMDDFRYAARNYFWIVDQASKQDKLFALWDSQELVYETILYLKSKGMSQRVGIIKARQLGVSTLTEGMIAWRSMFFRNADCFVVSYDDDHAAYLFSIMQHIYDKMPWWLRPECFSRKFETGLIFDTDPEQRRLRPGLNSKVTCKGAQAVTGVGQGRALVATHISEWADFHPAKAREIIEEDIENALGRTVECFGILETTAKGAGTYAHMLWKRMERLGEKANWYPLFLPFFADRDRVIVPLPANWKPQQDEIDIRDRARNDWVKCDNADCRKFTLSLFGGKVMDGQKCNFCGTGTFHPMIVSDHHLAWIENQRVNREDDEESLGKLRQEQASTAEESFQYSGVQLFSKAALRYANSTILHPISKGTVNKSGVFHGMNLTTGKCYVESCGVRHDHDENQIEVWELPEAGATYVMGVDTADGLGGKYDYSVAQMLRVSKYGGPDRQVAILASNTMDADSFAGAVNRFGRFYNEAMIAYETNAPSAGVMSHALRVTYGYPNLYKPLKSDNVSLQGNAYGWRTTEHSKKRLYTSMRKALTDRLVVLRDKVTVEELHTFRRENDQTERMGAATGQHDDRIMSMMISYAAAHERDWDEDGGMLMVRTPLTLETAPFRMTCYGCAAVFPAKTSQDYRQCPKCRTFHIGFDANLLRVYDEAPAVDPDAQEDGLQFNTPEYNAL